MDHSFFDGHGIFSRPLEHLLVHLVDFCRVHGPKAAFPLVGSADRRLLDLLEALVQTQVVTDRILPSRRRRLEVWEMLTEKKKYRSYKGGWL